MQWHDHALGEGVACDTSLEDGNLLCRCQSMTCDRKGQEGCPHDLVPGVCPSEDGFGCTRDVGDECWTELGTGSIHGKGADDQAQKRRHLGDCGIEHAPQRKCIEATKELNEYVERRKETLVDSGGALDADGLEEDVQELFIYGGDGTAVVRKWITDVRFNAFKGMAQVCRFVNWKMKTCHIARGKL